MCVRLRFRCRDWHGKTDILQILCVCDRCRYWHGKTDILQILCVCDSQIQVQILAGHGKTNNFVRTKFPAKKNSNRATTRQETQTTWNERGAAVFGPPQADGSVEEVSRGVVVQAVNEAPIPNPSPAFCKSQDRVVWQCQCSWDARAGVVRVAFIAIVGFEQGGEFRGDLNLLLWMLWMLCDVGFWAMVFGAMVVASGVVKGECRSKPGQEGCDEAGRVTCHSCFSSGTNAKGTATEEILRVCNCNKN